MKTTIQHVIDSLIEPVGLLDETVDSLYFGDPNANIAFVRVAGKANTPCRRIGLMAGYRGGGQLTIPLLEKENLDLIIYGGGPEWKHRNIFGMPHGRAEQRR